MTLAVNTSTFTAPRSYILEVHDEKNQLIARINSTTGEVEFGPGAPVEERAKEFWRILARYAPVDCCSKQGGEPWTGGTKNG